MNWILNNYFFFRRGIYPVWVAVALSLISFGCAGDNDNYLEGSVTDGYSMSFDSVRVRLYPESAVSVEYVKKGETGEQIPLRVTIDHPEPLIAAGGEYNLLTEGTIGRGVGYDSSPLPALVSGTIRLDEFKGSAGSEVVGDFEAVFTGTSGKKINLRGGFSSKLERVE